MYVDVGLPEPDGALRSITQGRGRHHHIRIAADAAAEKTLCMVKKGAFILVSHSLYRNLPVSTGTASDVNPCGALAFGNAVAS
jgi:hypothetical protein